MKILISTLLPTIAVFLHFGEVNASEIQKAGSSSRPSKRRHTELVDRDLDDGEPDKRVKFGDVDIDLWLDNTGSIVRKAFYKECYVPKGVYYRNYNFLICTINIDGFRLVAYKAEDNALIGIRAPKRLGQQIQLEPTESEWYIIYVSTHFTLTVDPASQIVTGIHLKPQNLHRRGQPPAEHVKIANIRFWVFRGSFKQITGAQLG